jgi:hypothetical protein
MTTSAPPPRPPAGASPSTALMPLNLIRTETVLSRLPIHNLSKKGTVQIQIIQKHADGHTELYWQVAPNPAFGIPRQLAYKLDTLVINKKLDELGRPLPKLLRLDSLRQMGKQLGLSTGKVVTDLRKAAHQNAGAYIIAKLHYTATDGTERTLEAGFTRYSVIFTGERLPDGRVADAVYLLLNDLYWDLLNSAPTRPLDYDYLQALPPAAQRCYEIISYKLFAALKYGHAEAKLLYSEYCTFAAQQRYADAPHVKKQMYKVHKPHLTSGYLASVRYEATTDAEGYPDWMMSYVPGPKARAEYAAFNARPGRRPALPAPSPQHAEPAAVPAAPSPAAADALTTQAHALVQHFHQRFHGTTDVIPSSKALTQARALITRYGLAQARHLVDFSSTAAQETDYRPQTFGGILQYTARARAAYAQAQECAAAAERAREERRRAQADEQLRQQYDVYRAARLAELRATTPPDILAAIEQAAAAQFDREHTHPFGRDLLRRYAIEDAIAAHFQLPSFAAWQAAQGPGARRGRRAAAVARAGPAGGAAGEADGGAAARSVWGVSG